MTNRPRRPPCQWLRANSAASTTEKANASLSRRATATGTSTTRSATAARATRRRHVGGAIAVGAAVCTVPTYDRWGTGPRVAPGEPVVGLAPPEPGGGALDPAARR